ncbi:adenosylmethionine decarboxylase [Roseibacillus ishigakijimensis]|uniref:S-adenosylmethionine decarboxylase proenzyme n=1 Tax=Roseibacillus ishigakijimensis TaxID=454146 RepID=A0A934RRJ1_9BACT|nr:adenosylmethionine decarboxylase [Roseibacillus ishigakijimensis]MBK1835598.1 adenosylmethionine decarboxylase [Roseibacillus ishigakijimensis]
MTSSSSPASTAPPAHSAYGVHIAMECRGCRAELLTNREALGAALREAATIAGATVVDSLLHQYNPAGLSGVVVIQESHLAIHTWPEIGYASFDIYTCGQPEIAEKIAQELLKRFQPEKTTRTLLHRQPPEE